jgi:predicted ABC-type ATPase
MKQVIVIFGNIASGKSTVSQLLAKALPTHKLINLDAFRVEVFRAKQGNGPIHADQIAQDLCLNEMKRTSRPIIYETTAVTRFSDRAFAYLRSRGYQLVFVHLRCSPETCLSRYQARKLEGHVQAPFAYGGKKSDIWQSIGYFHDEQARIRPNVHFDTETLPSDQIAQAIINYLNS